MWESVGQRDKDILGYNVNVYCTLRVPRVVPIAGCVAQAAIYWRKLAIIGAWESVGQWDRIKAKVKGKKAKGKS